MKKIIISALFLLASTALQAQFEIYEVVDAGPTACDGEIHVLVMGNAGPFRLDLYDANECLLFAAPNVSDGVYIFKTSSGVCAQTDGGLCPGDYIIKVNADGGCLFELQATIEEKPCDAEIVLLDISNVSFDAADKECCKDNSLCNDGSMRVRARGYVPPVYMKVEASDGKILYEQAGWTNPQLEWSSDRSLAQGTYTVTIMSEQDPTCELSKTITISACDSYTTTEGGDCYPIGDVKETEVDVQVIHAKNANDFSGELHARFPNADEENLSFYWVGPYVFLPDDKSEVPKIFDKSITGLAPGLYSFFVDNGCGAPQQFEYEIIGCKADLDIQPNLDKCGQAPFTPEHILVSGGVPPYDIYIEDIVRAGEPDRAGFKVVDATGCSEYYVWTHSNDIEYFVTQTFTENGGTISATIEVQSNDPFPPYEFYFNQQLLTSKLADPLSNDPSRYLVTLPSTLQNMNPLTLTMRNAKGCDFYFDVEVPDCPQNATPFEFSVELCDNVDDCDMKTPCDGNTHRYRLYNFVYDESLSNTITIFHNTGTKLTNHSADRDGTRVLLKSIPYDGEPEIIVEGLPSGEIWFGSSNGCTGSHLNNLEHAESNCTQEFECEVLLDEVQSGGNFSTPYLVIRQGDQCCDDGNCDINFYLNSHYSDVKSRYWTGWIEISYRDETHKYYIEDGKVLVDGVPVDQHNWAWDITGPGEYDVSIRYSNGCEFSTSFVKSGLGSGLQTLGYVEGSVRTCARCKERIPGYEVSFICDNCDYKGEYMLDQNECDYEDSYIYQYFEYDPNDLDNPCYGGGTIKVYRREGKNVVLKESFPVDGDYTVDVLNSRPQPWVDPKFQCLNGGRCFFDAYKLLGHKLALPIIAQWCSELVDYDDFWCREFPEEYCPEQTGGGGIECSNPQLDCPHIMMECKDGICAYPVTNGGYFGENCPEGYIPDASNNWCIPDPNYCEQDCEREGKTCRNGTCHYPVTNGGYNGANCPAGFIPNATNEWCIPDPDYCAMDCDGFDCISGRCVRPLCQLDIGRNGGDRELNDPFSIAHLQIDDIFKIKYDFSTKVPDRLIVSGEGIKALNGFEVGCSLGYGELEFRVIDPTKLVHIKVESCGEIKGFKVWASCPRDDIQPDSEFKNLSVKSTPPRSVESFDIGPNPFINTFNLNLSPKYNPRSIEIHSIHGNSIYYSEFNDYENRVLAIEDIAEFPPGMYLVTLTNHLGEKETKKIIKADNHQKEHND